MPVCPSLTPQGMEDVMLNLKYLLKIAIAFLIPQLGASIIVMVVRTLFDTATTMNEGTGLLFGVATIMSFVAAWIIAVREYKS